MVSMSFGEHIEELRTRLILALLGLMAGVIITFIPPLNLGKLVISQMQVPATAALKRFYADRARVRSEEARKNQAVTPTIDAIIPAEDFVRELHALAPKLDLPDPAVVKGRTVKIPIRHDESGMILTVSRTAEPKEALVSLAPLETMTIFFMVCVVTGLVIASPWVFYQAWAFVAAGLYRHEQRYVKRYLPYSLGLFLTGVFLCFWGVLPITLSFLLEFNVWLGIEPTLRLVDWMSFATILPLVFGLCFQTPLVMLFLERIGVFTVEDYRAKRKMAILIIVILGAVLTPGQDPFSQVLLAGPMIILYEFGIVLVGNQKAKALAEVS
ncbi:MAG: twin-arginine translocase subunit TatC [Isosphaeraceae bacterium]